MFTITKKENTYYIAGRLDENAKFATLPTDSTQLRISFKDLTRINSLGIKKWVTYISKLSAQLTFTHCPSFIIEQMIMLPEFRAGATIESFYLPFFCQGCNRESNQLVDISVVNDNIENSLATYTAKLHCDRCRGPLEFDDDAETFTKILNGLKMQEA